MMPNVTSLPVRASAAARVTAATERGLVADQVVGSEHEHDRVVAVSRPHEVRGDRDGRRGVAAEGFEQVRGVERLASRQARVNVLGAEVVVAIGDRDQTA